MQQIETVYVDHAGNVIIKKRDGSKLEVTGFTSLQQAELFADTGDFNETNNQFCEAHGVSLVFIHS